MTTVARQPIREVLAFAPMAACLILAIGAGFILAHYNQEEWGNTIWLAFIAFVSWFCGTLSDNWESASSPIKAAFMAVPTIAILGIWGLGALPYAILYAFLFAACNVLFAGEDGY